MINMFNLNLFKNIGFLLYLFVYLIIPYSAITQTLKVDFIRNLENSLNARDLELIRKNFRNEESKNSRGRYITSSCKNQVNIFFF